MKLIHRIGNALEPVSDRKYKLIVHCVNDIGAFGSGIAGVIAKKWPEVQKAYYNKNTQEGWHQGEYQMVKVKENIWVVNLCAQRSTGNFYETIPFRYESLQDGLIKLREKSGQHHNICFSMPRIGCSLAKGSWTKVEEVINRVLGNTDIEVQVYTLDNETDKFPKVEYV